MESKNEMAMKSGNIHVEKADLEGEGVEIKVVQGSEALAEAYLKEKPNPRSKEMLQLYGICLLAFFCSTMNGYDSSLMSSMLVMKPFQREFGSGVVGIKAAYINAMYSIGGVVALPFVGPSTDKWGRRMGMFIGCALVIIGTILQGTSSGAHSLGQFLAGRFILGFGVSIAHSAAPVYVVEVAHPAYRGTMTGFYNCLSDVGGIIGNSATRGSLVYNTNAAWLIPTWCQMICSSFVCVFVMFVPETPRWLYTHNKMEKAKEFITKYHGANQPDSLYVQMELREFGAHLEMDGADKRWWDYRALFKTKSDRYRLYCNLLVSCFGQWTSGGVGNYLGGFYATAGVTDPAIILDINLAGTCLNTAIAFVGARFCDRIGRRKLLLITLVLLTCCWIATTAGTASYANTGSVVAARTGIAFNFIWGWPFSFGFTPLQSLYPVEVLSYEQRAKGMAFSNLVVNAAVLVNQFGTPVALKNIGWKVYIVFTCWTAFETLIVYLFIVETNGFSLEELDDVFAAENPRKASTKKKTVVIPIEHDESPLR